MLRGPRWTWCAVVALLTTSAIAGPYDEAYFGAPWLASPDGVRPFVRGTIKEDKPTLSPWDVPHVRELGHLYYLEPKDFAKIVAALPVRGGGEVVTEYYFFRKQLAIIRVLHHYEHASFQGLLESLQADYGAPAKETSYSPEETFVQHTWTLPTLKMEVSYHPHKVPGGFACKELTLRMVHKTYVEQVTAYHETLKTKYGKE